jgi:hypothetical protein
MLIFCLELNNLGPVGQKGHQGNYETLIFVHVSLAKIYDFLNYTVFSNYKLAVITL